MLSLMGWCMGDYRAGPWQTAIDNETLSSLAGNAFSAFSSGVVALVALHMILP